MSRRPIRSQEDVEAIVRDAQHGAPGAIRLVALLLAAGHDGEPDWPQALSVMAAAAMAGDDEAQGELAMLSPDSELQAYLVKVARLGKPFPQEIWPDLAASVDLAEVLGAPPQKQICPAPLIGGAVNVTSPVMNQWLINRARPHLERARVVRPGVAGTVVDDQRTNSMVEFGFSSTGLPLLALRERMAAMIGIPASHFESSNLLHYTPGQAYFRHYDSFPPKTLIHQRHAAFGQRLVTVLVYLNDAYEGGETHFPKLDFKFRGEVGQALYWRNTLENSNEVDPLTLHEGLPPTAGEKWVLSQWVREKPVPIYRDTPSPDAF